MGSPTVTVDDDEVRFLFKKWKGDALERRMENAALEFAAQVDARARRYAHVMTSAMQGSIFHELGGADSDALATVGASASYSAIEDLRGLGLRWDEDLDFGSAGAGEHSFMSRGVKESLPTLADIFAHWMDPDTDA